ncbi:MAG TPA: GNAT family N-acetyltransferase [Kineosporiaceae bacterium]|nr:GNAT family N-acetyltransferase [Kineosporiaceae bacterium]
MDVLAFADAAAFAEQVGPVIERYPAFASILATNLDQSIHRPDDDARWFLIRDGEQAIGAAMHTTGFGLFLTPLPDRGAGAATSVLVEALQRAGVRPSVVNVPRGLTEPFLDVWEQRTGVKGRLTASSRLYEIESPPAPPTAGGTARLGSAADLDVASRWTQEFHQEADPGRPPIDAERAVRRRLARGRLLFWDHDGRPVSMAGVGRPIAGVARIGGVYTAKPHRRQGFGAAVTVAATRQGFDDGADRCVLYADLANPTSNGIYQAIGYRPIGDNATITFDVSRR